MSQSFEERVRELLPMRAGTDKCDRCGLRGRHIPGCIQESIPAIAAEADATEAELRAELARFKGYLKGKDEAYDNLIVENDQLRAEVERLGNLVMASEREAEPLRAKVAAGDEVLQGLDRKVPSHETLDALVESSECAYENDEGFECCDDDTEYDGPPCARCSVINNTSVARQRLDDALAAAARAAGLGGDR